MMNGNNLEYVQK